MYGGHGGWVRTDGMGMAVDMGMGRPMGAAGGLRLGAMGGDAGWYGRPAGGFPARPGGRGAPAGGGRAATFTEGKLFLGGLDSTTTKESLTMYCCRWGELIDAVVMEGRGFGFVTFEDPRNAQNFLEHRSHVIDGKGVEAKAAVPKGTGGSSNLTKKLFVGGTGELSDEDFRLHFERFGEIQDAAIVRRADGASRGFGFVTFSNEMSVEKCLVLHHELNGRKVDLRRAVPKDQMPMPGGFGMPMSMGSTRAGYGPLVAYGGTAMSEMAAMGSHIGGYQMGGYPMGAMPPYLQGYDTTFGPQVLKPHRFAPY
ncbi:unnamed protein product [Ostreobium quekettii]|uniref:RRM domain-containing protein n=1 Tax=Ostreobium quekettii TaxID=121088 RepID=A0A8S1IXB6_9CHLO|nr:unnamed protein product [Ostreobium quekettii]